MIVISVFYRSNHLLDRVYRNLNLSHTFFCQQPAECNKYPSRNKGANNQYICSIYTNNGI